MSIAERARKLGDKMSHSLCADREERQQRNAAVIEQALLAERRLAMEEAAKICDERYEKSMDFARKFDSADMQTMVDRALADAHEADRIRCALRAAAEKEVGTK